MLVWARIWEVLGGKRCREDHQRTVEGPWWDMAFLKTLWMALQPIVDLRTGQVIGHEALVRGPVGSQWEAPGEIVRRARRGKQGRQLEEACKRLALTTGRQALGEDQLLFMNVDLRYDVWPADADGKEVHPDRLAIEVSEHQDVLGHPHALERLHRWREAGHHIVLDDYGTGHSSLGTVLAVQPDMIKIDRYLVEGLDADRQRRIVVRAVLNLMRDLGIRVIVEGIETVEELRVLCELGAEYGQGFLLGLPAAHPMPSPCQLVVDELGVTTGRPAGVRAARPLPR